MKKTEELEVQEINNLKIAIEEMHCKRDSLLDCQDDLTKAYYSIKECMEENRYEHSMEEIFEGLFKFRNALDRYYISDTLRFVIGECYLDIKKLYDAGYRE